MDRPTFLLVLIALLLFAHYNGVRLVVVGLILLAVFEFPERFFGHDQEETDQGLEKFLTEKFVRVLVQEKERYAAEFATTMKEMREKFEAELTQMRDRFEVD